MLRGEFPATAYAAHVFACHFSKCATFSPALSISREYLIKIPFSKLLLMAFVDLSDASLRRKTKRCWFLRRGRCRMPQKPTLWPNEPFNIARSLRNISAPSVINTFSRHSTCLRRFGVQADKKQTAVGAESLRNFGGFQEAGTGFIRDMNEYISSVRTFIHSDTLKLLGRHVPTPSLNFKNFPYHKNKRKSTHVP